MGYRPGGHRVEHNWGTNTFGYETLKMCFMLGALGHLISFNLQMSWRLKALA